MVQFARPNSTVTLGLWLGQDSGTALHTYLDEAIRSDTDYIASSANQLTLCEVGLSSASTPQEGIRTLRYTYRRTVTNKNYTLVVRLMQGANVVQSWTHANPSTAFTLAQQTVSGTITDYTDLRLQFEVTVAAGGGGWMEVSWAEFEIPDGSGGGDWSGTETDASGNVTETEALVSLVAHSDTAAGTELLALAASLAVQLESAAGTDAESLGQAGGDQQLADADTAAGSEGSMLAAAPTVQLESATGTDAESVVESVYRVVLPVAKPGKLLIKRKNN